MSNKPRLNSELSTNDYKNATATPLLKRLINRQWNNMNKRQRRNAVGNEFIQKI